MPISYFPLEPDFIKPPPPPVSAQEQAPRAVAPAAFEGETTECNYLVLIFVVGVLFLALTDSMKR